MARFKKTFGVQVDINNFANLVRKWEGGEYTAKIGGKTYRGLCLKVDYLPLPYVQDLFNLVNLSQAQNSQNYSLLQLGRDAISRLQEETWRRLLSSAPEQEDDGADKVEEGELDEAADEEEGEKEVSNSAEVSLFEVAWFIKI